MQKNMLEILCCPSCKGELKLEIAGQNNGNIIEGKTICSNCRNEYLIYEGILRAYIPDKDIIALSDTSKFSKFIITPENLDKWIGRAKTINISNFFTNKLLVKFLLGFGWILLFFSFSFFILFYFNFYTLVNRNFSLSVIYLGVCIGLFFFIIDYLMYRRKAKAGYLNNLLTLRELLKKHILSEYDIRSFTKDTGRESSFKTEFESQKNFVSYKGKKIEEILDKYNLKVEKALSVGCGGALHKDVSTPYFDRGYNMIGVDINEEYLKQFNQIFNTDVAQVNSMALPFRSNQFDLINFTDLIEHLHHPLLGLREAQRVLKKDGVIILTTNNHCEVTFRCLNPLIFIEKVVSLYCVGTMSTRNIIGKWLDFNFYHTEFTKYEIIKLMNAANFKIISLETQFPHRHKLNKIFKKLPILKHMCSEFVIIGKKTAV